MTASLESIIEAARRHRDFDRIIEAIPYARFLGITVDVKGDEITTCMRYRPDLIGNLQLRHCMAARSVRYLSTHRFSSFYGLRTSYPCRRPSTSPSSTCAQLARGIPMRGQSSRSTVDVWRMCTP
jgi:hypothetical protein